MLYVNPCYVTQLFNNIDWASRVNQEKRKELGNRFVSAESWDTRSYTMDYLHYRVEEGQVGANLHWSPGSSPDALLLTVTSG